MDTLVITELPIKVWTRTYKNHLEELAKKEDSILADIREFHKDNSIRFELSVPKLKDMSKE